MVDRTKTQEKYEQIYREHLRDNWNKGDMNNLAILHEFSIELINKALSDQKQKFEEVLIDWGLINKEKKIIQKIKPNHGSCCTCQECGQSNEDCVCRSNSILEALNNQSSSPTQSLTLSPQQNSKLNVGCNENKEGEASSNPHAVSSGIKNEDKTPSSRNGSTQSEEDRGSNYSRVTLIVDGEKRYEEFDLRCVELSEQDNGRTLKIFIDSQKFKAQAGGK